MFNLFNKPQPSAPLPQRPIVQPRGSSHPTSVFNLPPQKVIRAEKDYSAKFTKELGFKKGDFFYVIGGDYVEYYEVINPETKQRGIVPVDCFENMLKSSKVQSAPPSTRFTSPRESLDRVFEVSTQEEENQDTIEQISVPAVESKENGIFNFIVELRFLNNRRRILHRTYGILLFQPNFNDSYM